MAGGAKAAATTSPARVLRKAEIMIFAPPDLQKLKTKYRLPVYLLNLTC
jgi:hypothetical protein